MDHRLCDLVHVEIGALAGPLAMTKRETNARRHHL
jgi:hypothetical protein